MRLFALLLACCFSLASPVHAMDDAVKSKMQEIIRGQMEALGRDDAEAAYGYATPAIRGMFPQASGFLEMVKRGYRPVYRHQSVDFMEIREGSGSIGQTVHIVDADGIPWDALYTLEQQPDGAWKISGCALLKSVEQAV